MLESFISDKNSNRILYVINLESKQNIRIGRGHDSDIRVTDISVSRFHAFIKKEKDGTFNIKDNNSKFGTLVLVQSNKINILNSITLPVQIGRSLIHLSVKKPFSLFSCICTSKKLEIETDYQIINSQSIDVDKSRYVKIQIEESHEDSISNSSNLKSKKENQITENDNYEDKFSINCRPNTLEEINPINIPNSINFRNPIEIESRDIPYNNDGIAEDAEKAFVLETPIIEFNSPLYNAYNINYISTNINRECIEKLKFDDANNYICLDEIREKLKLDLDSLRRVFYFYYF
jgi:hypothetical protein